MTGVEIWQALQLLRDTVIQAHVKINESMDQIEKLAAQIQKDLEGNVSN